MMNFEQRFRYELGLMRGRATRQEIKTIEGQALKGDIYGAMRGLETLRNKVCKREATLMAWNEFISRRVQNG